MKNTIQAAAVVLLAASTAQAQQAVQWKVSDGGNGHWYRMLITSSPTQWLQAKSLAESIGGHLATIRSSGENAICLAAAEGGPKLPGGSVWLGGIQPTGESSDYAWVTGEPFDWTPGCGFSNTDSGCGFEDRLTMTSPWTGCPWNDVAACWFIPALLVEWDADCNGDGIVDYGQCLDGTLPDYDGDNTPDCCEAGMPCVVGNYPVQWRAQDGGNGRWYQVSTYAVSPSWELARSDARSMGGDLTSFQSMEEMNFCLRLAEQRPNAWRRLPATGAWWGPWVGAFQEAGAAEPAGGWTWLEPQGLAFLSENRMTFNNQSGCCGGNENRLFMYANGPAVQLEFLELNDIPETGSCQGGCSHGPLVFSSVVEWSADCNNDGIVDYGQILTGQLGDANTNGVPDLCEQPSCSDVDLFRDGQVNGADLAALISQWGPATPTTVSDVNHDGRVDGADLSELLSFWGACP